MSKTKILQIGFFLVLIATKSFAQIEFVKAYFIDSRNQRTECLIKDVQWKNNPTEFIYKLSESDVQKTANVSSIKEFGINSSSKYIGVDVEIDRSSAEISDLKFNRNPVWEKERLFLKVLIEGKASLLVYKDGNMERFFLKANDTINQLIYKKYLGESNESKTNNAFRQQLWTDFKCGDVDQNSLKEINYNSPDLMKYVKSFNGCSGSEYVDYTNQGKRDGFNLKITPGINYGTLLIKDDYTPKHTKSGNFESKTNIRIGLEAEFVLPFNKNKWSLIVEPNYQSYNSKLIISSETYTAEYNSIEIPVGFRYYMFFNRDSRLFINALMGKSFVTKSSIDLDVYNGPFSASPSANIGAGLGYNFKKISVELRYYKNRDILDEYLSWTASYTRLSFILGIKIF